jgi:two-component system chemotaxis response regulator CheB
MSALESSRPTAPAAAGADQIVRVMVVDDSTVIRSALRRTLESNSAIKVIASVSNGKAAVDALKTQPVDVIVLDIEMPVMTGLEALPLLLEVAPTVKIIMASTLTVRGATVTFQALQLGAADFVPKPSNATALDPTQAFGRELIGKVKAFAAAAARRKAMRQGSAAPGTAAAGNRSGLYGEAKIALRQASSVVPKIFAIGSSTGGPQALFTLFETLGPRLQLPIVITQHMPATFTAILAERLGRISGLQAAEAVNGEPLVGGRIYVAPGDYHMVIENEGGRLVVQTNQAPPENFCRPAVDPMLRSVAQHFGASGLALILTGMGHDGREGARALIQAHGTVIAQDEASSVVWGMPGAVATNGLCSAVLPLERLGNHVLTLVGNRPR